MVLITTIFLPFVLAASYYLTISGIALQRLGLPAPAIIVYVLLGGLLWLQSMARPLLERQLSTLVNIPAILRQLDEYIHGFSIQRCFPVHPV